MESGGKQTRMSRKCQETCNKQHIHGYRCLTTSITVSALRTCSLFVEPEQTEKIICEWDWKILQIFRACEKNYIFTAAIFQNGHKLCFYSGNAYSLWYFFVVHMFLWLCLYYPFSHKSNDSDSTSKFYKPRCFQRYHFFLYWFFLGRKHLKAGS